MELSKIVKDLENFGVTIIFCPLEDTKGQQLGALDDSFILINQNLSDIEKINVLLHEKTHLLNQDTQNSLSQNKTFSHHIEKEAEENRIIDFMNLINTQYPIDENFNYLDYMQHAFIPNKFENLVKKEATKHFKENKHKK
ncbi:ImmA/IrrE family metallo-endopeptidase [Streptococcus mutans]|uniref:ImmA/IrrE family metallo-endopeptidase n=1 Tax=Streptococcus mutans TaxID=1309 RepID=UPI0009F62AFF|nr:ImmA/IrrE family metallo-endopeptidase [Streptococcus mutans]PNL99929.1 ImmA/IrrE family metallo-endopeptidase [Streptococcus mutans]PNM01733.1 ImmA/IrrE family metallo-endopeptidase [Streptococcus mutans]PNM01758.1 ImmA/IrrE family metallo-endopeptidase [Streptococcus mutans]